MRFIRVPHLVSGFALIAIISVAVFVSKQSSTPLQGAISSNAEPLRFQPNPMYGGCSMGNVSCYSNFTAVDGGMCEATGWKCGDQKCIILNNAWQGCGECDPGPNRDQKCADQSLCTAVWDGNTFTTKCGTCGDSIVSQGEECDDGNGFNGDNCTNFCKNKRCGDGIHANGEWCDDGNADETDACTSTCQQAICGDGFVQPKGKDNQVGGGDDEQCDDANNDPNDGCSACRSTVIPVCGNGIVEAQINETCDDGNTEQGDGCSPQCKWEPRAYCCVDGCSASHGLGSDTYLLYENGCVPYGPEMVLYKTPTQGQQACLNGGHGPGVVSQCSNYCSDPSKVDCRDFSPCEPDDTDEECRNALTELEPGTASKVWKKPYQTLTGPLCYLKNNFSCNLSVEPKCARCGSDYSLDGVEITKEDFWKAGYCDCTQTDKNSDYCENKDKDGDGTVEDDEFVYTIDMEEFLPPGEGSRVCRPPNDGQITPTGGGTSGTLAGTTSGTDAGGTTGTTSGTDAGGTAGTTAGGTTGTTGGQRGTAGTTAGTTTGTDGGATTGTTGGSASSPRPSSGSSRSSLSALSHSSNATRGYCCDSDKVCREREGCSLTFFNCLVECSGISVPSSSASSDDSSIASSGGSSSRPSSGTSRSSSTSRPPSSGSSATVASSVRSSSRSSVRSGSSDSDDSSRSRTSSSRSSSRTSSRSSSSRTSSRSSLPTSCRGDECGIGGDQFCGIQNMSCITTSNFPCIRCVGSASSTIVVNSCRGDECDLGGDAFCAIQNAACITSPNFPCIQCIPLATQSSQSSISVTITIPSSASSRPQIVLEQVCGDGTLDLGEECDDGNDFSGDGCSSSCEREFCGNGELDVGESCDQGEANSNNPNAECRPDCTPGRCGDGIQDTPLELCDDGNTNDGDGCSFDCKLERTGPTTLPAQVIQLPFTPPSSVAYSPPVYIPPTTPEPPTNTDTGPAALLFMIGGAAAGYSYMRRRK